MPPRKVRNPLTQRMVYMKGATYKAAIAKMKSKSNAKRTTNPTKKKDKKKPTKKMDKKKPTKKMDKKKPTKKIDKKKPTKKIDKTKKTDKKKTTKKIDKKVKKRSGPVSGRYYGIPGATKVASPLIKTAGKTKNYATRPSARALFDRGLTGPVIYDGTVHHMRFRANGSPYWAKA